MQLPLPFGQREFRSLALVDVLHHPQHALGLAIRTANHVAGFQQPAHLAVRPDAAVFDMVFFAALDTGIDGIDDFLPIPWVNGIEEVF
ncbi:MAG: hypothetical protein Q8R21_02745, partial [Burkholderiales bacterium]|nr:hypothetical protein [Burkholderiales bacterium]